MKPSEKLFMKDAAKIIWTVTCLSLGQAGYSQTISPPYEVATWQGFRTAAISYTFDDGCANQYTIALPMFDEFGFRHQDSVRSEHSM